MIYYTEATEEKLQRLLEAEFIHEGIYYNCVNVYYEIYPNVMMIVERIGKPPLDGQEYYAY